MSGETKAYMAMSMGAMHRGDLLLAMYEGAIGFLRQAIAAGERGDAQRFAHHLRRGQDIVAELLATIDRKPAPELASRLERLYEFMLFQLTEANVRGDAAPVQPVVRWLARMYDAYRGVIRNPTPELSTILAAGTAG